MTLDQISTFFAQYGALIGAILICLVICLFGSLLLAAMNGLYTAMGNLPNRTVVVNDDSNTEDAIKELNHTIDSMHDVLGGRLWKRDQFDQDTDGQTIQALLKSIDERLAAIAGSQSKPQETLIKPVR